MANSHKGEVAVKTADASYILHFSTNAICELEDVLEKPVIQIVAEFENEENVGMKIVRYLVWAGLTTKNPGMTVEEAGDILDEVGYALMMDKVGLAMRRFFPDPEGDETKNPQPAKAG